MPSTALGVLLANETFTTPDGKVITDPFVDDDLSHIPDISVTGPAFWTFFYRADVAAGSAGDCTAPIPTESRMMLSLTQSSYRVSLFADGIAVPIAPLGAPAGQNEAIGMFQRHDWDLGPTSAWCLSAVHGLALLVLPPDHPGNCSKAPGLGQGGNHEIAQDVISQDTAGWDWVMGTPDRNTGLFDPLIVASAPAGLLLRDAAAVTSALVLDPTDPAFATSLKALFRVSILNLDAKVAVSGTLTVTVASLNLLLSTPIVVPASPRGTWYEADTSMIALSHVSLWWPHTVGTPQLHPAMIVMNVTGRPIVSLEWQAGFRTVASTVDAGLNAQVFSINGKRIFLQGGNFIATDQFSRAPYRTLTRYTDEMRMHVEMGLNVVRLWGGHGGHAQGLWQAADTLGILLFFEFGMSGDNNGRWAGNYSWPLDHRLYIAAAGDLIRSVRGHASLLLYCGGNELWPLALNPPPDITHSLQAMIAAYDPRGTPFVQSSMGSGKADPFDPLYILAPDDGDYLIHNEAEFWLRNPGKEVNLPIGFQPEIGNTASPEFESLARMFSPAVREALPAKGANEEDVAPAWLWHTYLPFTEKATGVDHVWRLAPNATGVWDAVEYSAAAGVAQHWQYKALMEGFQSGMWSWYGAVIMWKSASPWPALRGSLYDWYLAQSGGYWGFKAATSAGAPLHVTLNLGNATVDVINKGLLDLVGPWEIGVAAYDISTGKLVQTYTPMSLPTLPAGTVTRLPGALSWPDGVALGANLLFRTEAMRGNAIQARSETILSTLSPSVAQNFSAIAAARVGRLLHLKVVAIGTLRGAVLTVGVSVGNPAGAAQIAIEVHAILRSPAAAVTSASGYTDDRVLPSWPSDGYVAILPGETWSVSIDAPLRFPNPASAAFIVEVRGWNAEKIMTAVVV